MKKIIQTRKIERLLHFTNIKNIPSIMENGLLTKENLEYNEIEHYYNDGSRNDGKGTICFSIEFPNYKMFYKLRSEKYQERWCVIEVSSDIILNNKCIFYEENAGSKVMFSSDSEDKMGRLALGKLFENEELRLKNELPENFTTNPQAEVCVCIDIPADYIKKIYCEYNTVGEDVKSMLSQEHKKLVEISSDYFQGRCDNAYWKNKGRDN